MITDETQDIDFFYTDSLPLTPPPYPEWIQDALENNTHMLKKTISSVNYINLIKIFFQHPFLVLRFLLTKVGIVINKK